MWSRSLLQRLSTTGTWLGASAAPRTWRLSCFVKHNLAILRHKGALAEEALRLVCMSERCSSMMLHVDASALALAALWDDDAEAQEHDGQLPHGLDSVRQGEGYGATVFEQARAALPDGHASYGGLRAPRSLLRLGR